MIPAGTQLGDYRLEALLGSGGMGEVYAARDVHLRRAVAIKILSGEQTDERARGALVRDARHASVLSHPCICAVHHVAESEGRPFIVMERVEGETVREAVTRAGRSTWFSTRLLRVQQPSSLCGSLP